MDDDIGKAEAWDRYTSPRHPPQPGRSRRWPVEPADASDSIDAVEGMIEYVEQFAAEGRASP